jgi:hypothetical protein
VLLISSCSDNPEEFTLGDEFIESQAGIRVIDTFTVKLSTVILDTMATGGTENMLIGNYEDNIFGKITCSSFFRLEIPEDVDVETNDTYDSLYLVIEYNNYYFGDTAKTQKITVHQLTENINIDDDDYLSNNSSFSYNSTPLGSITYTPQPNNETDTLAIKLNDALGRDLFTKLKDESDILTDSTAFINYFHGLMLKADEAYTGNVIGFAAAAGDIRMILYSSRVDKEKEEITHQFGYTETEKQFNNIKHDFSSTGLSSLKQQRYSLSSSATGGLSYLQGGIGLAIRVDIPSIQDILMLERGKIADAKLMIAPSVGSYRNESDLPGQLVLYKTDLLNRRNSQAVTGSGAYVTSTLTMDDLYHENTAFEFDLTYFLTSELSDNYVDPEDGLLITLNSTDIKTSLYRLIAEAGSKNTRLKIYYLSY